MPKMSYQEGAKVRQSGYLKEVSKNLMSDKGIGTSFKDALSKTAQAKAKGIQEVFDPLNIAKKLTFGSSIGPALLGTLTGRSKEDMEYFTGLKANKIKISKAPKVIPPNSTAKQILDDLYLMFNEQAEGEKRVRELKKNTAKERENKKEKNHQQLIEVLEMISGGKNPQIVQDEEKRTGSLLDALQMMRKVKMFGKQNIVPKTVLSTGVKMITGAGIGLTALLTSAEGTAGESGYNTVVGYQKTPKPLTEMTLKEVDDWQSHSKISGGAAGKYQIIRSTLRDAKSSMNLSDSDKFDKNLQDRIFNEFLINKRKNLSDYLSGKSDDIEAAQLDLAKEWASIPVPRDIVTNDGRKVKKGQSYYENVNGNRAGKTIEETQNSLKQQRDLNSGKIKPEETSNQTDVASATKTNNTATPVQSNKPEAKLDLPKSPEVAGNTTKNAAVSPMVEKTPTAVPSPVSPKKAEVVTKLSKENKNIKRNMNSSGTQLAVNNITTNINKPGDTNMYIIQSNQDSESILMQKTMGM